MNCAPVTTCGENMRLQNVLNSVAKRNYARIGRRRELSLKNVIISCVDLTFSFSQKFSHYYLQYFVLRQPSSYVMTTFLPIWDRLHNHNFCAFMNKVCLLIILSLLCFMDSAKCDQDIEQTYFPLQKMENLTSGLLNTSTAINVIKTLIKYEQTPLDFEEDFGSILSKNTFTGYTNHNKGRFVSFNHSRYKRSSNGLQFVPYSLETTHYSTLKNNLVENGTGRKVQKDMFDWSRYQRLVYIYIYMKALEERRPDIMKVISIGKSFEKRDIFVAKVGFSKPHKKPSIFIEAGIHGREWISPATAAFFLRELVEKPSNATLEILHQFDVYILPVANPDGYEYSHTKDRMWRKNRSRKQSFFPFSCVGVDLNRNFGYKWAGAKSDYRSSRKPCFETYVGRSPWSEPETRALRDFVRFGANANFVMYISLHSFGQKILYPWAYTSRPIQDWHELHVIAKQFAAKVFNVSRGKYVYEVGSSDGKINYNSFGNADDWARGEAGIKWTYLIELPPARNAFPPSKQIRGFLLPAKEIVPVAYSVFQGFQQMISSIRQLGYGKV